MKSLIILLVITLTIPGLVNAQSEFAIQWQGSYGGLDVDRAESIQHTNDGGFIIAGYTFSDDSIVIANHHMFDRAVSNLIDNALKFDTSSQQIELTIQNGSLTVSDRGIGIPEDEVRLIFERVHRSAASR